MSVTMHVLMLPVCMCMCTQAMLHEAEDKFYDRLRLGEKHPDTRVDFVVCDAHCMVQHTPAAGFATAPDPKQAR